MPLKFWDEAFITAVFLINRLPSLVIKNDTPYECSLASNRITPFYILLVVLAGRIYVPITLGSLNSDPKGVCS